MLAPSPLTFLGSILAFGLLANAPVAQTLRPQPGFSAKSLAAGEHLADAVDFAFDRQGQPWVLTEKELFALDTRVGGRRQVAHDLLQASAFLLLEDGVLLADAEGLVRLSREGEPVRRLFGDLLASGLQVSDLAWGLDGFVYGSLLGEGSWQGLAPGVFRMAADGSKLECWSRVEGGAAELALDASGEVFLTTAAGQVGHVVLPERDFFGQLVGWQVLEGVHGFSLFIYNGGTWPDEFAHSLLVGGGDARGISRSATLSMGASFRALGGEQGAFLHAMQEGFHVAALGGGPGGDMYVLLSGLEAGSLWRVGRAGRAEDSLHMEPIAKPDAKRPGALFDELEHPNLWRRLMAQRLLAGLELSGNALDQLAERAHQAQSPELPLQALWLGAGGADLIAWSLKNHAPSVRRNGLAVARDRFDSGRSRIPQGSVLSLVRDADERVRLQALSTWRQALGTNRIGELVQQYPKFTNDYARAAALSIATEHPLPTEKAIFRAAPSAAQYGDLLEDLAGYVAAHGSGRDTLGLLLGISAGKHVPLLQARVLIALYGEGRGREKPWPSPRMNSILRRVGDAETPAVALAALPLAYAWAGTQLASSKYAEWIERARRTLDGDSANLFERVLATRALLALPESRSTAISTAGLLLAQDLPAADARLLVQELATGDEPEAHAIVVRALPKLTGAALACAEQVFLTRPTWQNSLRAALTKGTLTKQQLSPILRKHLPN